MEWLIGALVVAAAAWIGRRTGKAGIPALAHGLRLAENDRLEAEARYLECLRRDIALALLEADPRRLLEAHAMVASFTRDMRDGSAERREAERSALSLKYPRYADFDFFGLRHFVPVRSGDFEPADAAARYVDLGRFLALMAAERGTLKLATDEFLREDRAVLERVVEHSVDDVLIRRTDERNCTSALKTDWADRDANVEVPESPQPTTVAQTQPLVRSRIGGRRSEAQGL